MRYSVTSTASLYRFMRGRETSRVWLGPTRSYIAPTIRSSTWWEREDGFLAHTLEWPSLARSVNIYLYVYIQGILVNESFWDINCKILSGGQFNQNLTRLRLEENVMERINLYMYMYSIKKNPLNTEEFWVDHRSNYFVQYTFNILNLLYRLLVGP